MTTEREKEVPPDRTTAARHLDLPLIRGIAWTGSIKWLSQILSWVSTVVVVRLLAPEDYGLVGMATVYLGFVALINEFGLGAAIITQRDISEEQLAQINALCILLGLGGLLVSCLAAYPLSVFFRAPGLPWVIAVMSLTFLVSGFQTAPMALLQRELRFKFLALTEGLQATVQALATVAFAYLGFHYWALVLGGIIGASLSAGMILSHRWLHFSWPRRESLGSSLTFSWQILAIRLTWIVANKADHLIAGRMLGQTALGVYMVASTIAQMPMEKITGLVSRVSFPLFSAVQSDLPAIRRYLLSLTEGLALLTFPLAVGLVLVTDEFVAVVLSDKWIEAVQPLRLLAILTLLRAIFPLLPQILTVTGHASFTLRIGIATAVVAPLGVYLGAFWGIVGIVLALCIMHPVNAVPMYWKVMKTIKLTMPEYIRALWPAVSGSLAMGLFVLVLKEVIPSHWPLALRFALLVFGGATAYVLSIWFVHRERVREFMKIIRAEKGQDEHGMVQT